ncbi:MAG: hypothetical protein LBK73_02865 [Treponema sp.]|jgi:hypothetical protein|nr:hypothetical protein [Treponema sp.]
MKRLLFVVAGVAAAFCACSSSNAEAALQEAFGINTRASAPVFLGVATVSATEIRFQFSLPVALLSARFSPDMDVESATEGTDVVITVSGGAAAGERVTADILVEDEHNNTLHTLTSFRTRNDRLPSFVLTEIRTETSKPKGEFVEVKLSSDGNLGALRLFSATNGVDAPLFEFEPVEVKKGEYVVIHLRTYEDGSVDEDGTDLAAASATEAQSTARDFWLPDAVERLRKTDAVFFLDQDDAVLDAVLFSADGTWGSKTYSGDMAKAAQMLGEQGAWTATSAGVVPAGGVPAPADAFSSANTTATRTICRREAAADTNTAGDWYITVGSGATPGKPNNTGVYAPKK